MIISMLSIFQEYPFIIWIIVALALLLMASALPEETPFSDICFQKFSQFISQNFNPTIYLASVPCMLFSFTENPDLLALHTRQQIQESIAQWFLPRSSVCHILFRTNYVSMERHC